MNQKSMTRDQQTDRRRSVYAYFKEISHESEGVKKESLYLKVANKFGYTNVNSVKAIISNLKSEESIKNKIALDYSRGIVDSSLFIQDSLMADISAEDLDIKYELNISQKIQDTITIEGSFNSGIGTREGFFDHFSATNVGKAISRLSSLFQECQKTFTENTKNK